MASRPRTLPGQFLAPNGRMRTKPLRPVPIVADEKDQIDRIKAAVRIQDEPECICDDAILDSWASVNRLIFTQQHVIEVAEAQDRRQDIAPQKRLDDVYRRGKQGHHDISHPIHLVQKEIDKATRRGQPVSSTGLRRLEGLEALLDGVSVLRMAA